MQAILKAAFLSARYAWWVRASLPHAAELIALSVLAVCRAGGRMDACHVGQVRALARRLAGA